MTQTAPGNYRTPESRCMQRLSKKLPISIIPEYHFANIFFLTTLIFSIIVYIYAASNRIKPAVYQSKINVEERCVARINKLAVSLKKRRWGN